MKKTAVIAAVAGLWFLFLASPRSFGEALVKFAFAAILLVFAYRRFMASPKKTPEIARHQEGGWVRFDVLPVAHPVNWFAAILAVGLGAGTVGSGVPYLWVMGLLFAAAAALVLLLDPRGGEATKHRSFRLGPEGIEIGGTLIHRSDIHHLRIKNKFADNLVIVYDANRGLATGTIAGLAHRRKLADVAFRVEVETGGKVHVLAAGLDEDTARAITLHAGQLIHASAPAR